MIYTYLYTTLIAGYYRDNKYNYLYKDKVFIIEKPLFISPQQIHVYLYNNTKGY